MGGTRARRRIHLVSGAARGLIRLLLRRGPDAPQGRDERSDHPRRGLPEEKAIEIALAATHEVREEMGRGRDREERLPAPSPEEVRRRREELRKKREDAGDRF